MQPTGYVDGRLPVFVFPTSLSFYWDDQSSHKQILTLYNPYDFSLKFRVLATSPNKYIVADSEGSIRPRCCVDIVIRHNAILSSNIGVTDKFRIQTQEYGHSQIYGKRDIISTLYAKKPDATATITAESEQFQQICPQSLGTSHKRQYSINGNRPGENAARFNFLLFLLGVVCLIALGLPTTGSEDTQWPPYLHVSTNQKLIAAYTLGLITVSLFRT